MATAAPARTQRMTATDLFRLRFVGDVAVSPDGSQVACVVTQADGEVNRNRSAIWVASVAGGGFVDRTRKQLFVMPVEGGEARQLTSGTMGVGQIAWSPDGTRIAFASNRDENEDRDRRMDVWTVEVASGALTQVTPHDGAYG